MDRDDVPATGAEQEKAAAFGDEELVDSEIGEEQALEGAPVAMSGSDPARTHLGSHGIDTTGASTGGVPPAVQTEPGREPADLGTGEPVADLGPGEAAASWSGESTAPAGGRVPGVTDTPGRDWDEPGAVGATSVDERAAADEEERDLDEPTDPDEGSARPGAF